LPSATKEIDPWRTKPRRRPLFFRSTLGELFSPSEELFCDFAEKNVTRPRMKEKVVSIPGVEVDFAER
jgi:hypothetical protein